MHAHKIIHLTYSCDPSSQPYRLWEAQERYGKFARPQLVVRRQGKVQGLEVLERSMGQHLLDTMRKGREKKFFLQFPLRRRDLPLSTGLAGMSFKKAQLEKADLIHLHWVAGRTLNWNKLAGVRRPMVYTLHDCWPLTAACHCPLDCIGYETHCQQCPQLGKPAGQHTLVSDLFAWKERAVSLIPSLTLIAPSLSMKKMAEASPMFFERRIECIYNPLDTDMFRPGDKQSMRLRWGIPQEATVVCFGCVDTQSAYKGGELIEPVLRRIRDKGLRNVHLLIFGHPPRTENTVFPCTYTGYLDSMKDIASVYQSADVLINTSKQDSFSYVTAEAQACGVPGVAFNTGGIPEIMLHDRTGLISPQFDLDDMANNLYRLITDRSIRNTMGLLARELAVERFCYPVIAAKHDELYKEICSGFVAIDNRENISTIL